MSRALPIVRALALLMAALAPFLRPASEVAGASQDITDFPTTIDGRPLTPAPVSELEAPWIARFPGRIGRFKDENRLWILRMTSVPTIDLHSSARCLRAAGWHVQAGDAHRDAKGRVWSSYVATLGTRKLAVRECVQSMSTEASWPDIDVWRWDAWRGRDPRPWCAYTAITTEPP